jgi:gliding motility-associated-like protein
MFKKIFLFICVNIMFFPRADAYCPVEKTIQNKSEKRISFADVPSPQPVCVSVLATGDVTINWIVPTDPGGTFNSYRIFSSAALGGPYTLIDSVFILSQNTYTHIGANANSASVYYYISTYNNTGILSPATDTVRSIFLSVTNPGNGTAILNWNAIASPPISSSAGAYSIYREYPVGAWSLIKTTTNLYAIDTILICDDFINYRVEIEDNSGCTSVSSIDGETFQNTIVPSIPVIDTLSLDDSNNAVLDWNASPSTDVEAYVIYKFSGGIWVAIDTVTGINNINYTNLSSTAGTGSEQYRLTAYDSCGNVSPLGTVQKTIYLTSSAEICTRSAILSWTAYSSIGTGLAGYRIYQSDSGPGGPYVLKGTVGRAILTYTVAGLPPNLTYHFKIVAFDSSGTKTASSNRLSFFSSAPVPPLFSYLKKVSVVDPNMIDVVCYVDSMASTRSYKILRSKDTVTANYIQVGTVLFNNTSLITFRDYNVSTDQFSYYYKIVNVDSCGYDGIETNVGRSMLAKAMGQSGYVNTLTWNDYENWSGNVMSYNIYRGIDGNFGTDPLTNIPFTGAGTNFFTDDIYTSLQGQGMFSYYVEAVEGMGNIYGFNEKSISNITEAYQESEVFIPNAFKPAGINSVFKPVTTYVSISDYDFKIFNRWSDLVFSTTNIEEGWDGAHKGKRAESGVYVYLLTFKTARGEFIEKRGYVTLIR